MKSSIPAMIAMTGIFASKQKKRGDPMRNKPRNPFSMQLTTRDMGPRVLIGAYIPETLFRDLSATALFQGLSRSEMIEIIVTAYLKNNNKLSSDVINKLSRRAIAEWDSFRMASFGKMNWQEREELVQYRITLAKTLKKRGLTKEVTDKIIERIR